MKRTLGFLIGGGGFLSGLLLGTFWAPALTLIVLGIILILGILITLWPKVSARRLITFILFTFLGLLYLSFRQSVLTRSIPWERKVALQADVVRCQDFFQSSHCILDVRKPYKIRLVTTLKENHLPGNILVLEGVPSHLPQDKSYLYGDGVSASLNLPMIISASENLLSWRRVFSQIKLSVEQRLINALTEPSASLTTGLLFGSRQNFSDDFMDSLKRTNTMHIIAVSGFNITILTEFIRRILGFLSKKQVFITTSILVVAFVLMIGAPESAVRAGIMGIALLLGRLIGRRVYIPSLIVLTALLMALPNPYILRYNLGFQLSFLAFVGLVALGPFIESRLSFLPPIFREITGATVGATLAVMPILVSLSGGFVSLIGPLINLIILPLVPLIMLLGFIVLLASLTWSAVANSLGILIFLPSLFVVTVIEKASRVPLATVSWPVGLAVLALFLLLLIFSKKGRVYAH